MCAPRVAEARVHSSTEARKGEKIKRRKTKRKGGKVSTGREMRWVANCTTKGERRETKGETILDEGVSECEGEGQVPRR